MILLRSLLYVGFIVAVVAGWFLNRSSQKHPVQHQQESKVNLDTPEAIHDALKHTRWQVRLSAVEALQNATNPHVLDTLLDMLGDPVMDIREAVSREIVAYGEEAVPGLGTVLVSGKLVAREAAVQALAAIGSPSTIPVLAQALREDESTWVRLPAAQGLGAIGGEAASFALMIALEDPDPDVVKAVEQALHHNAYRGTLTAPEETIAFDSTAEPDEGEQKI